LLELVEPGGAALCPECGWLLRWFSRRSAARPFGIETLLNDIGADSLDLVELMMELEDEIGVSIPPEELRGVRTVGELIRLIQRYREAGAEPEE
jgi:acyl carrier protein